MIRNDVRQDRHHGHSRGRGRQAQGWRVVRVGGGVTGGHNYAFLPHIAPPPFGPKTEKEVHYGGWYNMGGMFLGKIGQNFIGLLRRYQKKISSGGHIMGNVK